MKKIIIGFILGGILFGTIGVLAATTISSNNVIYQNKKVNTALDELYEDAVTGKEVIAAAITNKGVSTTSSDSYETMAANINSIDTNHSELELLWENPTPGTGTGTSNFTVSLSAQTSGYRGFIMYALNSGTTDTYSKTYIDNDNIQNKRIYTSNNGTMWRSVTINDDSITFSRPYSGNAGAVGTYCIPQKIWGVR